MSKFFRKNIFFEILLFGQFQTFAKVAYKYVHKQVGLNIILLMATLARSFDKNAF